MSNSATPVVAAIPNYNRGDTLPNTLLPLLEQEYQGVVVMDDASSDDSREVVNSFKSEVEWVSGDINVGSGANRNRVMESQTLAKLGSAIIHFVDADTVVTSDHTPERIREIVRYPGLGVAGGRVYNQESRPRCFNYGPNICGPLRVIRAYGTGAVNLAVQSLDRVNPEKTAKLRGALDFLLRDWPNDNQILSARNTGWILEANMMIDSQIFDRVGGFDPRLRFHEIQDLVRRLERWNLICRFDPSVQTIQTGGNVQGLRRSVNELKATVRLTARYSLPKNRRPALQ